MRKIVLEIVVFICGAVVMIFELVGSRVLAPHLGMSIYVWTSLIGVILASLSLGYFFGGKVADKKPKEEILSLIIFLSAIGVLFCVVSKDFVLRLVLASFADIRFASVISTIILFAPATVLLGMVSPYAAKLKIKNLSRSGSTVGNLYAISTVGSIAGTFTSGFFLIAFFGSTNVLVFISLILVFTSIILNFNRIYLKVFFIFICISLFASINYAAKEKEKIGFLDIDTNYSRILIFPTKDKKTHEDIRVLKTDPFSSQGAIFLSSDELVFDYTKFFRIAPLVVPDIKNALMIGGAAYTYPRDFLRRNSGANMDVVEIDPKMTFLAEKYFGLENDDRLKIYHEDGRTFLNRRMDKKYDVIFMDAFKSLEIPFQLASKEAVQMEFDKLEDGGAVIVNIISAIDGPMGKFLRAEYGTYQSVFPQVFVFTLADASAQDEQNLILVAIKSGNKFNFEDAKYKAFGNLWNGEIASDLPVLVDNYSPVEKYMSGLILDKKL